MVGYTHEITLPSGHRMPLLGLGTWQMLPEEVPQSVETAIRAGYRLIDCAYLYSNQKEIGATLNKLIGDVVPRKDLFIVSKIWNHQHSYQEATKCIDESLKDLQLFYIDLMHIHFPMGVEEGGSMHPKNDDGTTKYSDVDYLETWKALEDAHKAGKVRAIGLSNFNHKQIQRVLDNCTIKPCNLQIEMNPYLPQKKLIDYCKANGITVTAYSSLGNPECYIRKTSPDLPLVLNEPLLSEIANKYQRTVPQIVLRWAVQQNITVLPKSVIPSQILENSDIFSFTLSDADMQRIDALENGFRLLELRAAYGSHPHYPFNEEY